MGQHDVSECICHSRTFEEIKSYAEKYDVDSVDELQEENFCSNSCGLCVPYVELTLSTGQTVFKPGEPHRKKRK